ncbi:TetR family transcriptional regulator [Rhodococcus koreensis]|uniref:TetR family transcriptional regulator n=1 Tax=Rhodococcus koreensis TaxID=99653 RepID=UPI00366B3481
MTRNADETRRKLLEAATSEFAQYGIAGARVDRITKSAGVNNALLYRYFGSKLDLFDIVYSRLVTETVDQVPLDVDDLPGYAVRLYDYYSTHPNVIRLTAWSQLERPGQPLPQAARDAQQDKTERIVAAQQEGVLPNMLPADELLALIVHLSLANTPLVPNAQEHIDRDRRRTSVLTATRAILNGAADTSAGSHDTLASTDSSRQHAG